MLSVTFEGVASMASAHSPSLPSSSSSSCFPSMVLQAEASVGRRTATKDVLDELTFTVRFHDY